MHPGFGDHHRLHAGAHRGSRAQRRMISCTPSWSQNGCPGRPSASRCAADASEVGQGRVLHQAVGDVDAKAVHAAREPELEDRVELGAHGLVRPVQIRLRRIEQMQVPLAVLDLLPGRAAEDRRPVVRWRRAAVASVAEHEAGARVASRAGGERLHEPGVFAGQVIGNEVDDDADAVAMRVGDQSARRRRAIRSAALIARKSETS